MSEVEIIFDDYRADLKAEAKYFKQWSKGRLIWNPRTQGKYVNPERQPICCLK